MRTSDPNMRKIFRAMQKYGLIVADNGSDMYITGTFDTRWNNDILNPAFSTLSASDFEVVQLGWKPAAARRPALASIARQPEFRRRRQSGHGHGYLERRAGVAGSRFRCRARARAVTVPATVTVAGGRIRRDIRHRDVVGPGDDGDVADGHLQRRAEDHDVHRQSGGGSHGNAVRTDIGADERRGRDARDGDGEAVSPGARRGRRVTLKSSAPAVAAVPASVTVGAGATSATFTINTTRPAKNRSVTITATYAGVTRSASLTIKRS